MLSFNYLKNGRPDATVGLRGPARLVSHGGRSGLQATSVKTRVALPAHTLNAERGSLSFWLLPLEDLGTSIGNPSIEKNEGTFRLYPLLADHEDLRQSGQVGEALTRFVLMWDSGWYPQLFAQFFKGHLYPDAYMPQQFRAVVTTGHFNFQRLRWYHLTLVWDKPASRYDLYANGVPIARSNQFNPLTADACGETLYLGNPALAFGDVRFDEQALDEAAVRARFEAEDVTHDDALLRELRHVYAGEDRAAFRWAPSAEWACALSLPLNRAEDLDAFYVQGMQSAPSITPEGLLIATALDREHAMPVDDQGQVYLWTRELFEGDLAVEFEFMPLRENGLSLLMLQASGMQREDFMADYPLRTNGSMATVHRENVRNYHWEFFREMDDCRHDIASHVMLKNPWLRPLAYGCQKRRLTQNTWHTLQFVQEGTRIRGSINGELVIDAEDTPFAGHGPVYSTGHVAIRCMWKTRNLYRNLRVWNRALPYNVTAL